MIERDWGELRAGLYQGNLLNPAVRREIADLNRLFLERALQTVHDDAWFRLPPTAVAKLVGASTEAWDRAARSPIALFEVRLPDLGDAETGSGGSVAELSVEPGVDRSQAEARRAFGVTALGVIRRLIDGVPLASRIAFGLEAHVEARLWSMSLSDSYRLAAWPGLIRPRWPGHERYWSLLADAVTQGDGVHWAYAAGLCLLGQCERQPPTVACSAKRPVRPRHRRTLPVRPDVPC